jgi:hypothetical protein
MGNNKGEEGEEKQLAMLKTNEKKMKSLGQTKIKSIKRE